MQQIDVSSLLPVLDWISKNCNYGISTYQEDLRILRSLLKEFPASLFSEELSYQNAPLMNKDLSALLTVAELYDRAALRCLSKKKYNEYEATSNKCLHLCNMLQKAIIKGDIGQQDIHLRINNLQLSRAVQAGLSACDDPEIMITHLLEASMQSQHTQADYFLTLIYHLLLSICYLLTGNHELFYNRASILKARILKNFKTKFSADLEEILISQIIFLKVVGATGTRKEVMRATLVLGMLFDGLNLVVDKQNPEQINPSLDNCLSLVESLTVDVSKHIKSLIEELKNIPEKVEISDNPTPLSSSRRMITRSKSQGNIAAKLSKSVKQPKIKPTVEKTAPEVSAGYSVRIFKSTNTMDLDQAVSVKRFVDRSRKTQKKTEAPLTARSGAYDLFKSGIMAFDQVVNLEENLQRDSHKTESMFIKFFGRSHAEKSERTRRKLLNSVGNSPATTQKHSGEVEWSQLTSLKPWRINSARLQSASDKDLTTLHRQHGEGSLQRNNIDSMISTQRPIGSLPKRSKIHPTNEESSFKDTVGEPSKPHLLGENRVNTKDPNSAIPLGLSNLDGNTATKGSIRQKSYKTVRGHEVRSYANAFIQMRTTAEILEYDKTGSQQIMNSKNPSTVLPQEKSTSRIFRLVPATDSALNIDSLMQGIVDPPVFKRQNSAEKLEIKTPIDNQQVGSQPVQRDDSEVVSISAKAKFKPNQGKSISHTKNAGLISGSNKIRHPESFRQSASLSSIYLQDNSSWNCQALKAARFSIKPEQFMIERPFTVLRASIPKATENLVVVMEEARSSQQHQTQDQTVDSKPDKTGQGIPSVPSQMNLNLSRGRSGDHFDTNTISDNRLAGRDTNKSRGSHVMTESREDLDGSPEIGMSPKQHINESSLHHSQNLHTFGATAMAITAALQLGNKMNPKLSVPLSGCNSMRADSEKKSSGSKKDILAPPSESNITSLRRGLTTIQESKSIKRRTLSIKNVLDNYGLTRVKELATGVNGASSVPRNSNNFASAAVSRFNRTKLEQNRQMHRYEKNEIPESSRRKRTTERGKVSTKQPPSHADDGLEVNSSQQKSSQRAIKQATLLDFDEHSSPNLHPIQRFDGALMNQVRFVTGSELSLDSENRTPKHTQYPEGQVQTKFGSGLNRSHRSNLNNTISDEVGGTPGMLEPMQELQSAENVRMQTLSPDDKLHSSFRKNNMKIVTTSKLQTRKSISKAISHQISHDVVASLERSHHVLPKMLSPLYSIDGDVCSPILDKMILTSVANDTSMVQSQHGAFQSKERRRRSKKLELLPQNRACEILGEFFEKAKLKYKRLGYFVLRFARIFDNPIDPDLIEFETTSNIGIPFKIHAENFVDTSNYLIPIERIRSKSTELADLRGESGFLPIMFKTEGTTFIREYTLNTRRNFHMLKIKFVSLASSGLNRSGKVVKNKPLELNFANTTTGAYLKIGLSNHMRVSGNRNNGMVAWLNLVNYLRQHVEHLDLDSLAKTMLLFPPKSGIEGPFTQKNQIFMKLCLLLVSNRCILVRNTLGGYQVKFLDPILKYYRDDTIKRLRDKQAERLLKRQVFQPFHDQLGIITLTRLGVFGPVYSDGVKVLEDGYFYEFNPSKDDSQALRDIPTSEPLKPIAQEGVDKITSLAHHEDTFTRRNMVGFEPEIESLASHSESDGESSIHFPAENSTSSPGHIGNIFQGTPEFGRLNTILAEPRNRRKFKRISSIMHRTNAIHKTVFLESDFEFRGFSPLQTVILDPEQQELTNNRKVVPFDELIGLFEDPRTRISNTILARVSEKSADFMPIPSKDPKQLSSASIKRISHTVQRSSSAGCIEEVNYPRLFKFNPILLSVPFKVWIRGSLTYILLHVYRSPFKLSVEYLSKSNKKFSPRQEASIPYEWIEAYIENKEKLRTMLFQDFYCENGSIWRRVSKDDKSPVQKVLDIVPSAYSVPVAASTSEADAYEHPAELVENIKDIRVDYPSQNPSLVSPSPPGRDTNLQTPKYRGLETNMGVFKIFASGMASFGPKSRTGADRKTPGGSTPTKFIHGMRHMPSSAVRLTKKTKVLPLDDSLFPEFVVFTRVEISGELINTALSYNPTEKAVYVKMQSPGLKYCIKQKITESSSVDRLKAIMTSGSRETTKVAYCLNLIPTKSLLGPCLKIAARPGSINPNVRWQDFSRSNGLSNALRKILYQSEVQKDISSLFDVLKYFVTINSSNFGRVAINCSLFYTYRNFDCFLIMDFFPSKFPNIVLKLLLNKADIDAHVSSEIKHRLFDKAFIVKTLIQFSDKIIFEKSPSGYSRTKIRYQLGSRFKDQCIFAPLTNCSEYSDGYLERTDASIQVVGIYNLRLSGQYCVASVYQHSSMEQFGVELYFPRTHKRYCFDIYNQELLMMDKTLVQDMYTVSSSEILYLAEKCRFDYREICQEIANTKKEFNTLSNKDKEVTMQDRRSESIVLNLVRKKKDSNPMTAEEENLMKKANKFLMYYQWEHILKNLEIIFNPTGTAGVKIANFKAPLRETLVKHFNESHNKQAGSYWFEASITHKNSSPARFFASGLTGVSKDVILESEMLMRINFVGSEISKNDKLKIWELLALYPFKKFKLEKQGSIKYHDLLLLGLKVFKDFRKNFSKSVSTSLGEFTLPQLNMISYFSSDGRAYYPQKSNSSFKVVDRQFVLEQYPILLLRKVLTRQPMSLVVVMVLDRETLEFIRYSLTGDRLLNLQKPMSEIEQVIPFARTMLGQPGCRQELGERLFNTFKNSLLLNFKRLELLAN